MSPLCYFAYNPNLVNKPPVLPVSSVQRRMWNRINGGFVSVRRTPIGLMKLITSGHPYTATHRGYRHERNFIKGQTLSLDFDTGDGQSSIPGLMDDPFIAANATFLYTTPSHTLEKPRARAVFVLDTAVGSPAIYALAARSLVRLYQQSDQSCKDPARIFFGSKDCATRWIGNRMPLVVLRDIMEQVRQEDLEMKEKAASIVVTDISDQTLREEINLGLNKILKAPDGERHLVRLQISRLFGGYVAAGYIPLSEAKNHLVSAATMNTNSPVNEIERDLDTGLKSGMAYPVAISPKSLEDYGLFLPG